MSYLFSGGCLNRARSDSGARGWLRRWDSCTVTIGRIAPRVPFWLRAFTVQRPCRSMKGAWNSTIEICNKIKFVDEEAQKCAYWPRNQMAQLKVGNRFGRTPSSSTWCASTRSNDNSTSCCTVSAPQSESWWCATASMRCVAVESRIQLGVDPSSEL